MGYYDEPKNVDHYESMCEGYDGAKLYQLLEKHLAPGSSILELGTGPAYDLAYLKEKYQITGSDLSDEFLKRARDKYPELTFHQLDAKSIKIDQQFDCIFSNKVLHHFTVEELQESYLRQKEVLCPGGLFAHTFWIGEEDMNLHGMFFKYHNKEELLELTSQSFEVVDTFSYEEFAPGDSLFIIARNR